MKKVLITLTITLMSVVSAWAQRFAYVDSDYILKHVPEYASSQKQLAALSQQFQAQVDSRFQEIDRLYKAYQADQVLMTADMKNAAKPRL